MRLLSDASYFSMQAQIRSQADTIRYLNKEISKLEADNVMLSERIAMFETKLGVSGIMNEDGSFKDDAETVLKTASIVLSKLEELR